jgi:thiamine biosynthesis protein ThiI
MILVSLVSSGIDSPVATYLLSSKVDHIILVHADNFPFSDEREQENFLALAQQLKRCCHCKITAVSLPHGQVLAELQKKCTPRFLCVLCKRMLVRYAEAVAVQNNSPGIIMGDSLGQVASQTLQNLQVVEQATKLPLLRPLIGLDKEEIIEIARDIGTYDVSIAPSSGCSAVPKKPATQAALAAIVEEEEKINVSGFVRTAIAQSTTVL